MEGLDSKIFQPGIRTLLLNSLSGLHKRPEGGDKIFYLLYQEVSNADVQIEVSGLSAGAAGLPHSLEA